MLIFQLCSITVIVLELRFNDLVLNELTHTHIHIHLHTHTPTTTTPLTKYHYTTLHRHL